MITALTFRQSAGIVTWTCLLIRNGLHAYAWGRTLDQAHGRAMELLRAMESNR